MHHKVLCHIAPECGMSRPAALRACSPVLLPHLARGQVGLEVLGVVENMSGLQQRVAGLRFYSTPASGAAAAEPVDVTEAALAALAQVAPDLVAHSDVFVPTKGGAQAMAADMGVPFLGRVPLDPALSLAGARTPCCAWCMLHAGAVALLRGVAAWLLATVTPVKCVQALGSVDVSSTECTWLQASRGGPRLRARRGRPPQAAWRCAGSLTSWCCGRMV